MRRRRFIKYGLLSSVFAQAPQAAIAKREKVITDEPPAFRTDKLSILQGATDESKTQFSVLHEAGRDLLFVVVSSSTEVFLPDRVETINFKDSRQSLSKPYFSNLRIDDEYELEVREKDQVIDRRQFVMLNVDKSQVKFAIASCMDESRHEPKIWQDMVAQSPDFIIFAGDSVYADRSRGSEDWGTADPSLLWHRFCDARRTLEIYHSDRLIPIFATWDDHDFGKNDTGKSYPYIRESQENFLNFFAQHESHCRILTRGPGVSSALVVGDQLFLLMDDRSEREDESSNKRFAHWGKEQEAWALQMVDQHQGFVWIINGTQIFPSMIFKESVLKHHPKQLEGFCSELKSRGTRCAFVSGDVHYSEVSKIEDEWLGYETYEITSSSIHSRVVPGAPDLIPNKRRMVATGKRNYVLVQSHSMKKGQFMEVTSHSKLGKINFTRSLIVSSED